MKILVISVHPDDETLGCGGTLLRYQSQGNEIYCAFITNNSRDHKITQDAIEDAYADNIFEETAIIVRSNKRANLYNQQIRNNILLKENELDAGDYLMVVKNNYFWALQ